MDLREIELGPISKVEIYRDQAELRAARCELTGGAQAIANPVDFGNWLFPLLNQRTFSNI